MEQMTFIQYLNQMSIQSLLGINPHSKIEKRETLYWIESKGKLILMTENEPK